MTKRYQIFISSTYDDLKQERQELWQTLISFEYIVAGMEVFPAANEEQFSFIKKQISVSDYYILIIGGRYGTLSGDGLSYTEKEFDYALDQNIPILVFPIKDPGSVALSKTDEDPEKFKKLSAFRKRVSHKRIIKFWSNSSELSLAVIQALQTAIAANPRPGWVRGDTIASDDIKDSYLKLQDDYAALQDRYNKIVPMKNNFDQKQLSSWTQIEFENTKTKETQSARISVNDILAELSITELFNEETLEQAVKGAISRKSDADYDDIIITEWQLDRAIILLARLDIAKIDDSGTMVQIVRGKHFLPANIMVKSKGWVNKIG